MNYSIINVNIPDEYKVVIGNGILDFLCDYLKDNYKSTKDVVMITDSNVYRLYADKMINILKQCGISCKIFCFEAGEERKNIKTLDEIYDFLIENSAERSTPIVAMGGGVTGDLAGMAASTYMRGVPLIHIPTSLLAMVDSSIGGKTGIDHKSGKNLIGTFYQPDVVITDVDFIDTLPDREFISSMGEIIKYGIIADKGLFEYLTENYESILKRDKKYVLEVVKRSVKNKVDIIEKDEKELSIRAILNFGHTFGHALENVTNYRKYLHGEAISIGMAVAARLSLNNNLCSEEEYNKIVKLTELYKLPSKVPEDISEEKLLNAMKADKKVKNRSICYVLTKGVGKTIIRCDLASKEIMDAINESKK